MRWWTHSGNTGLTLSVPHSAAIIGEMWEYSELAQYRPESAHNRTGHLPQVEVEIVVRPQLLPAAQMYRTLNKVFVGLISKSDIKVKRGGYKSG